MKIYRLHKYNPHLYDREGRYLGGDWTHVSDIGCERSGSTLTSEEYHQVEDAYIKAINCILDYQEIELLQIFSDGYMVQEVEDYQERLLNIDPMLDLVYRQGDWVNRERAEIFCRLCLRELQGYALSDRDSCFVCFTGDFYVHVGCGALTEKVLKLIEATGLTLECKGRIGDVSLDNDFYRGLLPDRDTPLSV